MSGTEIFSSMLVTQLFVFGLYRITQWLSRPLSREEYELWTSPSLQRLYYERLKKQFNRLRAKVPKLDSIIEHDEEYLAIAELAASKRSNRNLAIGSHYINCDQPLHQWVVLNVDLLPNEILADVYHEARVLDREFADQIVYNV